MTLKEKLQERARKLKQLRDEKAAQYKAEIDAMDAKLLALRQLYNTWDTLTIEQGLAEAEKAGLKITVD